MIDQRIVINCKDVQKLTGKCQQRASQMIVLVRTILDKPRPKLVTFGDFCKVYGITEAEIKEVLSEKKAKLNL